MTDMEKNKVEASTLYLVATPIGNLADISERAIKVLSQVDFIAAEDTRNTAKLLSCYGIKKELVSYFEHNKKKRGEEILARLQNGESCALVTDAGMPAISDPGEDMVRLARENGVKVTVIPGACAAVSALALSALSTARFCFEGFLSPVKGERLARLEAVKHETRTMIFYEAPHKLRTTLSDMRDIFGGARKIALARELTKLNEEVVTITLEEAVLYYTDHDPRGEYVLVIEGMDETTVPTEEDNPLLALSPEAHIAHYESMGMSRMDATKRAAKDRGMTKSELYKIVHTNS